MRKKLLNEFADSQLDILSGFEPLLDGESSLADELWEHFGFSFSDNDTDEADPATQDKGDTPSEESVPTDIQESNTDVPDEPTEPQSNLVPEISFDFEIEADTTAGQWHLDNGGGVDINVQAIWPQYTGSGVVVGIVDGGVQFTHHQLDGNYDTSLDYDNVINVADGSNKYSSEWHGTAAAGIIAAEKDGTGTQGVAYEATITSFRTQGQPGESIDGGMADILDSLNQQVNVDVSNNSWGFTLPFGEQFFADQIDAALENVVQNGRGGLGTVFIFSSGNDGDIGDNGNYSEMQNSRFNFSVGAVDSSGNLADFSTPGTPVLLVAPGVSVITTDPMGSAGAVSGDLVSVNGTSFAVPVVSGVVALMLEANPNLGYRDVQEILAYSSKQIDSADATWEFNGAGNWNGGGLHFSESYGSGLVDATAAVRLAETWDTTAATYANEQTVSTQSATLNESISFGTTVDIINVSSDLVIDHAEVQLNMTHSFSGDLVIKLISPSGTESILFDRPNFGNNFTDYSPNSSLSSTHHWGESATGNWILRVEDNGTGGSGTLIDWTLNLYGDSVSNSNTYVYTDEYGNFTNPGDAARRTLTDTSGTDTINAAAVSSDVTLDLTAGGSLSSIGGNTLTIGSGTTIEHVYTGSGNDTIMGNSSFNTLNGGLGDDIYQFKNGFGLDTIVDSGGSDTVDFSQNLHVAITVDLNSGVGDEATTGTFTVNWAGNIIDNVIGTNRADSITGNNGDNSLSGAAGIDTLIGGVGNDILNGGTQNDIMDGGSGWDTYVFEDGWGQETIIDASGFDTVNLSAVTNDLTVDLNVSVGNEVTDGLFTLNWASGVIENATTGSGDDTLIGNGAFNALDGGLGDDTYVYSNSFGVDTIADAGGTDTLDFSQHLHVAVTVDLNSSAGNEVSAGPFSINWEGDVIENVIGTNRGDTITGNSAGNTITTGWGEDIITGGAGNDTLDGGAFSDTYIFADGWGADTILDVTGNDSLDLSTVTTNLTVNLNVGAGNEVTDGTNTINWTDGIENIATGSGNDTITDRSNMFNAFDGGLGDDTYKFSNAFGKDTITDSGGSDTIDFSQHLHVAITVDLNSGAGNEVSAGPYSLNWTNDAIENVIGTNRGDSITGNSANNSLVGGWGADTLIGGAGNDTLDGGMFGDTYIFADGWGTDTILDATGSDSLDFSTTTTDITVNLNTGAGDEATDGTNTVNWTDSMENVSTGSGNDTIIDKSNSFNAFDGGLGDDTYQFSNAFGIDTIIDSGGTDTIDFSQHLHVAVTVDLNSSAGNEVSAGPYSVNWDNDAIENVIGTNRSDTVTGNSADNIIDTGWGEDTLIGGGGNDTLLGGAFNDTYQGFTGAFGNDVVDDTSGGGDVLDLSNFNQANVLSWQALDSNSDTFVDQLFMDFGSGNSITVDNYFNNTSTDDDLSGSDVGLIETITFADGSLDFAGIQGVIA